MPMLYRRSARPLSSWARSNERSALSNRPAVNATRPASKSLPRLLVAQLASGGLGCDVDRPTERNDDQPRN